MEVGISNMCGHLVVNDVTFHDIEGLAVLADLNYSNLHTPPSRSDVEIYNSTFVNIRHNPTLEEDYYGYSPSSVFGYGVIATVAEGVGGVMTESSIYMKHNTFYGNTLPMIGTGEGVSLKNLSIQNNAIQTSLYSKDATGESYVLPIVSGDSLVSGNLLMPFTSSVNATFPGGGVILAGATYPIPSTLPSGYVQTEDFKLGPLQDNGGAAPLGVNSSAGHVLTMRPLAGSPLIDGAVSVGLDRDQRNTSRSFMGSYDVGAVEVTLAEYTADGGNVTSGSPEDRLSETGLSMWISAAIGAVGMLVGLTMTMVRKRKSMDFS